jgi:hypothetical protein
MFIRIFVIAMNKAIETDVKTKAFNVSYVLIFYFIISYRF